MTFRNTLSTRLIAYMLLGIAAILVAIPLLFVVSSAFKDEVAIFAEPMKLVPTEPIGSNFERLAENFPLYIFNSFKVTITIVVVQLLTATTGAYAFSKLSWKGRELLFLTYVASIMIPIQSVIIPQFTLVRNLGLYDSHLALVLVSAFTAFGTFLVRQFFMTIPDSLLESARIDGAGEWQIFWRIMLPLSKPVVATLVIFSFRWFWNDFFSPLIYITSRELKTLPLGMADFVTQYYTYYGAQMAAALISMVPVMVVFLAAQRYFVQGIVTTGIK